ncbi:MAG: ABC transporter permease subunit [Candidatus Dormibacteraeota bacterium]|nr:ABC transporter permease subunit [Candidatus Dormibacteraeota bacterium]MBV9526504.1 ABC transporter permease subunit [Candidatus Dormibacteraeota bacterium]
MSFSLGRVGAVFHKEFREFRRNRFILGTIVVLPLLFIIVPISDLFRHAAPALARVQVGTSLLLMLVAPVIMPATLAGYAVVGEREQGTLEPVLTTPVSRQELLLGKALAAFVPSVVVGYGLFTVVVIAVRIGADSTVVDAVWQAPNFLAQALFAPLLAAWSIWVGIAISTRASDVRVAQQLGTLASIPALGLVALMSFQVLQPSITLAIILASVLAVVDIAAWRIVARLFDRERLITGRQMR